MASALACLMWLSSVIPCPFLSGCSSLLSCLYPSGGPCFSSKMMCFWQFPGNIDSSLWIWSWPKIGSRRRSSFCHFDPGSCLKNRSKLTRWTSIDSILSCMSSKTVLQACCWRSWMKPSSVVSSYSSIGSWSSKMHASWMETTTPSSSSVIWPQTPALWLMGLESSISGRFGSFETVFDLSLVFVFLNLLRRGRSFRPSIPSSTFCLCQLLSRICSELAVL